MNHVKKRRILLVAIIFLCCFISIGYLSIMQSTIVDAKIRLKQATWKVKFTNVSTTNITGSAQNYENPVMTDNFISLFPSFSEPGDSISYRIRVTNAGSLRAGVSSINVLSDLEGIVDFEYTDINIGDVLDPRESKYFNVKFKYNPKATVVSQREDRITLLINWVQAPN